MGREGLGGRCGCVCRWRREDLGATLRDDRETSVGIEGYGDRKRVWGKETTAIGEEEEERDF